MSYPSAPTRTLPDKPSLAELQEQAKEFLVSYKAGKDAAQCVARNTAEDLDLRRPDDGI